MKRLYFVRHGLSEMNIRGEMSGHIDTPLTPEGHEQAKRAGQKAREQGISFDIILSSPLQRAHDTAKHIARHVDYDENAIELHDFLKERHYGVLEGSKSIYVDPRYMIDESVIDKHEGVEPLHEMQERANKAIEHIKSLDHDTVLIVAHGAIGRALYRAVNNLPINKRNIRYKNAEIVRFI
jgi:probable phosphoglycerate mutase